MGLAGQALNLPSRSGTATASVMSPRNQLGEFPQEWIAAACFARVEHVVSFVQEGTFLPSVREEPPGGRLRQRFPRLSIQECVVTVSIQRVPSVAQREGASGLQAPRWKTLSRFVTSVKASVHVQNVGGFWT